MAGLYPVTPQHRHSDNESLDPFSSEPGSGPMFVMVASSPVRSSVSSAAADCSCTAARCRPALRRRHASAADRRYADRRGRHRSGSWVRGRTAAHRPGGWAISVLRVVAYGPPPRAAATAGWLRSTAATSSRLGCPDPDRSVPSDGRQWSGRDSAPEMLRHVCALSHAELLQNVVHVILDGAHLDSQAHCDRTIAQAERDVIGDLRLAGGQQWT